MEALIQACKAYQAKNGTDEGFEAAKSARLCVLSFSESDISSSLKGGNAMNIARAILLATRPGLVTGETDLESSKAAALRLTTYKLALQSIMQRSDSCEESVTKLISVLDSEVNTLVSPVDVSEVAEAALDVFESDCAHAYAALDILPKALFMLNAMGGSTELPGGESCPACQISDFCQGIVQRVCQHSWPASSIAQVLLALRGFPLTQDSMHEALQHAMARSKSAGIHDLPSIVHQLLALSSKGCQETVLKEIIKLFEQREAALCGSDEEHSRRQLLEVEGSVLLHIDMAAKHDAELGQAWLRYLKSETPLCSPFMLAMSFMLATIQRFEQPVIDALKALVLGSLKDEAALSASAWLPSRPGQPLKSPSGTELKASLLQCVRHSALGQGVIVQPIAQLATMLMESSGEKRGHFMPDGSLNAKGSSPAALAGDIGMLMLLELFKGHRDFRKDILSTCHNHLIGAKEDAAAPFVRLIALLVRQQGPIVAEYINDFKVSLENLAFLPPNAALSLLLAVWPLCRARQDVQDYVVMLLRKAMFSREVHARLLAARGFLYMIVEELNNPVNTPAETEAWNKAASSSSQISLSQMSALSAGTGGGTLLHELMSFLRRCLSQQAEVRRALYDGMPAVLAADPSAQESIVEPLLPHFCQYYETDKQLTPPLKLEACARVQGDAVRVVEPLQHMLFGLRRVLRVAAAPSGATDAGNFHLGTDLSDMGGEDAGAMAEVLREKFKTLRARLVSCTLEDFQIDQSTDYVAGHPAGDMNHALADILLGCMEVMLEDLVDEIADCGGSNSEQLAADMLSLFKQYQRLVDLAIQGKSSSKAKKVEGLTQALGGRKRAGGLLPGGAAKQANVSSTPSVDKRVPVLSISCLCKLLDAISDDGLSGAGMDGAGSSTMSANLKLARDTQFQTFVLSSALRVLQACAASETSAAIANGTAGSEADGDAVQELLALPSWRQLALPLFRAVQTVVLACAGQRVVAAGPGKKEKDPTEPLTQAAVKALEQLLAMEHTSNGVAALLSEVPLPDAELVIKTGLPELHGFSEPERLIYKRLPHLKELLHVLVEHCCGKELETMCACLQHIAGLLPAELASCVGNWAVHASTMARLQHPGAAKGIVQLALRCKAPSDEDVALLQDLAEEIKVVVNDEDAEESEKYPILGGSTIKAVIMVLLTHLESLLTNLNWALAKLNILMPSGKETPSLRQAQLQRKWEEAAFQRLQRLVEVCVALVETRITGPSCDALLKTCTHLYKVLGTASKAQFAPKGITQSSPCRAFQEMVATANRICTGAVYNFISDAHAQNYENDAAAGNMEDEDEGAVRKRARAVATAANRAKRESKMIPNLIFAIEDYEKQLIRLSKTGKMNLMLTAKRSTNRDFKLTFTGAGEQGGRPPKQPRQDIEVGEAGV